MNRNGPVVKEVNNGLVSSIFCLDFGGNKERGHEHYKIELGRQSHGFFPLAPNPVRPARVEEFRYRRLP